MDAESVLGLMEQYGLPVILLGAAIYALYRFIVFSLYEVKNCLLYTSPSPRD